MSLQKFLYQNLNINTADLAVLAEKFPELSDEMAIPSYLHWNPLIKCIVARRMLSTIDMLKLGINDHLMDFGCGTGVLLLQIPQDTCTLTGVDVHLEPAKIMISNSGRGDITLLQENEWDIHIPDYSLDKIVALEVLEHVDNVTNLAKKFRKKLAANGILVVSGPTENRFYRMARKIAGFSGEYHHRNIDQIIAELIDSDFCIDQKISLPVSGPLCLFKIFRLKIFHNDAD